MGYGDQTGPAGAGPMTGRGMGRCGCGQGPEAAMRRGFGGGCHGGHRGRGHGHGRHAHMGHRRSRFGCHEEWTPEQEAEVLRHRAARLQWALDRVNRRLETLAGDQAEG